MGTFNLGGLGATRRGMTLMVAYGSNLDPALMAERVGPYIVHAVGTAPGYKLAFAGHSRRWNGPVATLVKAARSAAPIVVYSLDADQMETMDANEGVGIGVYRRETIKVDTGIGKVNAVVYLHNSPVGGKPPDAYVEVVRNGYKAFGLDEAKLDAAVRGLR